MNTKLAEKTLSNGTNASQQPVVNREQLIRAVAMAVMGHSMKDLGGIDRIEDLYFKDVAELPAAGTVFATIAEELQTCGVETDGTVGSVMKAFGFEYGSRKAADAAHEIGCHCHGEFISPSIASERILNLINVAI